MTKIIEFLKKVWDKIKWILGFAITIIVSVFAGKFINDLTNLRKEKDNKNFKVIDDKTISIKDGKENKIIKLPKDPETNEQIKSDQVKVVGIAKEGKLNVKIKHKATNRRINIDM